jgi:hypothetical protein
MLITPYKANAPNRSVRQSATMALVNMPVTNLGFITIPGLLRRCGSGGIVRN